MNAIIHRLSTLTVANVMTEKVVSVLRADTMSDAAQLMTFHNIQGLAVVDEMGRCIGILSASDIVMRSKQRNTAHNGATLPMQEHRAQREAEGYRIVAEMVDAVSTYMSDALQAVSPDTPLIEVAEIMHAQNVHRLPVLDEDQRAIGMVTMTDVLGAIVESVHELRYSVGP